MQCCGWVRNAGDGGFSTEQPPTTFMILYKGSRNSRKREAKGTVFFNKYVILWLCLQLRQRGVYTLLISFSLLFLGSFKKEIKPSYDFFLKVIFVAMLHERLHVLFWLFCCLCGFQSLKRKKNKKKKTEVQNSFLGFFLSFSS